MPWSDRVAILLDGEFVKKSLQNRLKRFPSHLDVMSEVGRILKHEHVGALTLYRIFYYTAEPFTGTATHPLSHSMIDFGATEAFRSNRRLIDRIENEPDVAVRRGTLVHQGWQIGPKAVELLTRGEKQAVEEGDIVPKFQQKGVDMRIGLDVASLAIKRLVSTIILVTGDADLVPAMKLARREGLRVYLDTLQSPHVRPELKIHADRVLS